jgi:hypothetical protein
MLIGASQPEPAFLQRLRNNPPPIADPVIMPAGYIDHHKGPKLPGGRDARTASTNSKIDPSVVVAVVMMDEDTLTATETTPENHPKTTPENHPKTTPENHPKTSPENHPKTSPENHPKTDNTFMQNINHDINELVDAVNTTASSILHTITRWF